MQPPVSTADNEGMKVNVNEARKLIHYQPGFVPDFTTHPCH
jgi:hypothetical protein